MQDIFISGTGVWTPPHKISNEELVKSFNSYVELFNVSRTSARRNGLVPPNCLICPCLFCFSFFLAVLQSTMPLDSVGTVAQIPWTLQSKLCDIPFCFRRATRTAWCEIRHDLLHKGCWYSFCCFVYVM